MVKDPELLKQLLKGGNILPMEEMLEIADERKSDSDLRAAIEYSA